MRPRIRTAVVTVAAVIALLAVTGATPAQAAPARADRGSSHSNHTTDYLALGDSLAAGFQPGLGDDKDGGYVGGVLASLQEHHPTTQLTNLACSGETTTTMLTGGICAYPEGSQLAAAVSFLRAHRDSTRLVTIDIGANNVLPCARPTIDAACAASAIGTVGRQLTQILRSLRAAAPGAQIVVLNYYDPILAAWLLGPEGRLLAIASIPLTLALNAAIAAASGVVHGRVADVASAFSTTDLSGTPIPVNVARICAWTWMCSKGDIHANDVGYAVLAGAVEEVLPGRRAA